MMGVRDKGDDEKSGREHREKRIKSRAIRNLFLIYFFTATISGRQEIFASACASFPFVIPMIFCKKSISALRLVRHSLALGILGITAALLYMLIVNVKDYYGWLAVAAYSFCSCVLYGFAGQGLPENRRMLMKSLIILSVCFVAFL